MNLNDTCCAADFVRAAKHELDIFTRNDAMSDYEIAITLRHVALQDDYSNWPERDWVNIQGTIFSHAAVGLMVTLALLEFPHYYASKELAQFN